MAVPTLSEQAFLDRFLRSVFHAALQHVRGEPPLEAELDLLVRGEIAELNQLHGPSYVESLARDVSRQLTRTSEADGFERPGTWLSDIRLVDAEAAASFAEAHGIDALLPAIEWYAQHGHCLRTAPTLQACVTEFCIDRQCNGVKALTLGHYRQTLRHLARFTNALALGDVKPAMIRQFLARIPNQHTRAGEWKTLRLFFEWTVRHHYLLQNPVDAACAQPRSESTRRTIFTPSETKRLLKQVKNSSEIGYWVLALFAGMRTGEIERLQQHPAPWTLINLKTGIIDLPDALTKTGRRVVRISPVLAAWLRWIRKCGFAFVPAVADRRTRATQRSVLEPRCAMNTHHTGVPVSDMRYQNVARRSFISYALALPGASFAQVSNQVGNTERTIRRYYFRRVAAREARAYFGLTPQAVH